MSHLVHLWQSLKLPLWRFPSIAYAFHDARRVFKPRSNVHGLLLQFPEMLPSDSCTLSSRGGGRGVWGGLLLSSSSYCLVPMSCETRSWPDHRFNNTPWYTRFSPRCGTRYPKNVYQSLTFGVWVPFSTHYTLDSDGICFKVYKKKKLDSGATPCRITHRDDKCRWHIVCRFAGG